MKSQAAPTPRPSRCLISLGANIGSPADTIRRAAMLLSARIAYESNGLRLSRLFRTPPIGGPSGQPPFVNAVAAIDTLADPWQLWQCIRDIERELGRERNQRWEARKIDLDILLFDNLRVWTPHLKIPHPRMAMRRFILIPALDVATDWRDPVTGWTMQQLAGNLIDGAASVVLIARLGNRSSQLLQQAARQAVAQWIDPKVVAMETSALPKQNTLACNLDGNSKESPGGDRSRWVGLISSAILDAKASFQLQPQPKLTMFLTDPVGNEDVAWEDYHRQLAQQLCLMEMPNSQPKCGWPLAGPRYILASDDAQWAIHEIVAALEAMDCPIEPLSAS